MTSYVSILSCLSGGQEESSKNDCDKVHSNSDENLSDGDQKEITEVVEDLMTIQNKDVLRRNLVTLVTENITLKKQKKQLQTDLETRKEAANYSFQIDCDGAKDEVETVSAPSRVTSGGSPRTGGSSRQTTTPCPAPGIT